MSHNCVRPTIGFLLVLSLSASLALGGVARVGDLTPADIPADLSPALKELIQQTFSAVPSERREAAKELGDMGETAAPAVRFLIRLLADDSIVPLPEDGRSGQSGNRVGREADHALVKIGASAVTICIAALEDASGIERRILASQLGHFKDTRVVAPLIRQLSVPDHGLRSCAMGSLLEYQGPLPPNQILPLLLPSLNDSDQYSREMAIALVGKLGAPDAVESLTKLLEDKNDLTRSDAVEALAKIHDPRVLPLLMKILHDPNEVRAVRSNAADGLGHVGGQSATAALTKILANRQASSDVRSDVAGVMVRYGNRGMLETLFEVVNDTSDAPEVRWLALLAVAKIEGDQAVPLLTRLAKAKDEHWLVRFSATERLVQIMHGRIDDMDLVTSLRNCRGPRVERSDPYARASESDRALREIAENGLTWNVRLAAREILHGVPSDVYEQKYYIIFPILAMLYYALILVGWLFFYRRRPGRERTKLWKASLLALMTIGTPLLVKAIYLWYPW